MFKDFWKIDQSQGESRFARLLGIWILICLIAFLIWYQEGANLNGPNFKNANVSFSDISDAELEDANFEGANLEGTEILDSNLHSTNSLYPKKSFDAVVDRVKESVVMVVTYE